MQPLLEYFSHPELEIPCIHVTGSKGKGSVVTMTGSIIKASGLETVGLFRSPALTDFTDRISEVDGPFKEAVYQKAFIKLKAGLQKIGRPIPDSYKHLEKAASPSLTYFELVTLFAFLVFREAKCDFVVYEVFAGGENDPTNVIRPKVSVINTIELEHTELLGDTLEKIATEKAGIIKPKTPVVIGPQEKEGVKSTLRKIAKEKKASELIFIPENLQTTYFLDDENHLRMRVEELNVDLKLVGDFQGLNALVSVAAAKVAIPTVSETAVRVGLEKVSLPGRFEINTSAELINYPKVPYLVLDGAHTKNSIKGTIKTLEIYRTLLKKQKTYDSCLTDFAKEKQPLLLFACAKNKRVEEMAEAIRGHFSKIILTKPGDFKAADLPRAKAAFHKSETIENYETAIKTALDTAEKEGIGLVVTGSLYLVGEVKRYLEKTYASVLHALGHDTLKETVKNYWEAQK